MQFAEPNGQILLVPFTNYITAHNVNDLHIYTLQHTIPMRDYEEMQMYDRQTQSNKQSPFSFKILIVVGQKSKYILVA